MKFSQRMGITPVSKDIQIDSMDGDLRNGLWNVFRLIILDQIGSNQILTSTQKRSFGIFLWHDYFKETIDEVPIEFSAIKQKIKNHYYSPYLHWYEIYDLIEHSVILAKGKPFNIDVTGFYNAANQVLEREFAGYRFINGKLSPITNGHEIHEIEQSITSTQTFTSLKGCNIHLTESLRMLSDKQSPDYRNSIKESVSAIESLCKVISGKTTDTLGTTLMAVKDKVGLHSALERGFKSIYGYTSDTSDASGIRHGLMDEPDCDFDDAKYMLVSSSAFINYLISKANKAGINFT